MGRLKFILLGEQLDSLDTILDRRVGGEHAFGARLPLLDGLHDVHVRGGTVGNFEDFLVAPQAP